MRQSVIGVFLSVPLACAALVACGSDSEGGGSGSSAGAANGGVSGAAAGSGGAHSAGKANGNAGADTSNGGAAHAGSSNSGGSAGAPDTGSAGDTGNAGAGGSVDQPPPLPAVVYTMSNNADSNQVLGFARAADGSLTPMPSPFATGGKGSGAGLGEQGAVAYDLLQQRIYAVNAGDSSFSVFSVKEDGTLSQALNVTSAGFGGAAASLLGPKSITFHGNTVYALFQGTAAVPSMIAGWTVTKNGASFTATAIAGSALPLSSDTKSVDPAQIEFTPDGKWLIVTEKQSGAAGSVAGPGSIDSFAVNSAGLATKQGFYPTAKVGTTNAFQMTPFGFEFLGSTLIVSEAGSTGVGSYTFASGVVAPVATSQFLPTDPAPCWVAVSGNFAYVTNARGPNISGFRVAANGALSNIGPIKNAIVASTGEAIADPGGTIFHGPTDEFVSEDGKFLYALNAAVPSIGIFQIQANGTLARVGSGDYNPGLTALPKGSAGIVAR